MSNVIYDSNDLAEDLGDIDEFDSEELVNATVTEGGEAPAGMSFTVTLQGYTLHGIEEMVVQATATKLAGGPFSDNAMSKQIEDRTMELVTARIDRKLEDITADVVDRPMIKRGFGKEAPVTLRDYIGLHGREYLEQKVGRDGKVTTSLGYRSRAMSRAEWLVGEHLDRHFKNEISAATSEMIREVRNELKAAHAAILEEEKARIRKALEHELGAAA